MAGKPCDPHMQSTLGEGDKTKIWRTPGERCVCGGGEGGGGGGGAGRTWVKFQCQGCDPYIELPPCRTLNFANSHITNTHLHTHSS